MLDRALQDSCETLAAVGGAHVEGIVKSVRTHFGSGAAAPHMTCHTVGL